MVQMKTDGPNGIQGVIVAPLKVIEDDRGAVLHMLRADAPHFTGFGEVYFSQVNPGVVKAWKRHRRMTQRFAVPVGRIKVVINDDRDGSMTRGRTAEYILGRPDAYQLLIIPPMVWYGFQGFSREPSIMANCSDIPHDPAETEQVGIDAAAIGYHFQ